MDKPCEVDNVKHVLGETALLQIVALGSHTLKRHPEGDGDGFRSDIAKDGAFGDARSEEPESNEEVDGVGGEESIAQKDEEKRVARGCLLCAPASLLHQINR